jgi:diaminopimelate epimerase
MIEFVKMHGLGNDFMVINAVEEAVSLTSLEIRKLANRRLGVGFDRTTMRKWCTLCRTFDFQ